MGRRIKRARERHRLSQRQLAERLGVDVKSIDNWEHDRTRPRSSIGALEHVLGISIDGGQELPPEVAANLHDQSIMNIWEGTLSPEEKMIAIRALLAFRRQRRDDAASLSPPPR